MATQHNAITSASDCHEPKGLPALNAGATDADKTYVSDGAGSGTWGWQTHIVQHLIEDLTIATYNGYIVFPYNVTINSMQSVIDSAFTTADKVVTLYIGATPITGGSLTIAYSSSAAGDVDSCTCTAANTLTAGTPLKITATGGSGGTGGYHGGSGTGTAANLTIKYTRTS